MSPSLVRTDPSYPAYPILSFLAFILALVPLPWHLQAWNSGTCLFMIWTSLGCLNLFINSVLWHGNALDKAPIWCDISSRFIVGLAVAIPASLLCITRRLYCIASVQTNGITRADRRRAIAVDLVIGLGIPVLQMVLQIIVEGHRYDIFEDIGCHPALFHTPPAYPITLVWPLVIGLVSFVYSVLTLCAFIRRRAQFCQLMAANACISTNRYLRLMALSTTEILFNTPLSAIGLYLNYISNPIQPWKGWDDAHFDYAAVDLIPSVVWRANPLGVLALELSRWSPVFCAFLFFAFFGFADEARKNYRNLYIGFTKRLESISSIGNGGSARMKGSNAESSFSGSLPVFVRRPLDFPRPVSLASTARLSSVEKSGLPPYDSDMMPDCKVMSRATSTSSSSPLSLHHTQYDNVNAFNQTSQDYRVGLQEPPSHIQNDAVDALCRFSLTDPVSSLPSSPTASNSEQCTTEVASPTSFDMSVESHPMSSPLPSPTFSGFTLYDTIYIEEGALPNTL